MWSPRSIDLMPRMIASLSIIFACSGRCSQIWMPGTFVVIGLNSPRISAGRVRLHVVAVDVRRGRRGARS